ncbi:hypothetical protein GHT07_21030 [Caenimonas koreensis DSM 17982]|uniref:Uncharacterized protein n=1 Tax=Caenimonas koreensis DSM 17982 TaxID=1121255 RepID=A0A844AYX5_9BURK|nr:hypothetical protein [Caenimonas koreensis]MRD49760.1 hypothetical protein [Caenimonas koreensis DSM 17982]
MRTVTYCTENEETPFAAIALAKQMLAEGAPDLRAESALIALALHARKNGDTN